MSDPTFEVVVTAERDQLIAEAVSAEAAAVGINLQVRREEPGALSAFHDGSFDLYLAQAPQDALLPAWMERVLLRDFDRLLPDSELAELEELVARMTDPTASEAEIEAASKEAHTHVLNQVWRIPFGFNAVTWGVRDNFHGLDRMQEGVTGLADLRYLYVTR